MHIEKITDQLDAAMSLSQTEASSSPSQNAKDATMPQLPPNIAKIRSMTTEEVLADLNKSPLFMTDMEDNDDIAALQALNYEGSALENAADFKERGNECFKVRGYVDAREFYTKGVHVLATEERKRARGEVTKDPEGVPDSEDEIQRQREMLEAMHVNRAACHLALSNYRSCWLDCGAALKLNPRNVKACYRSARALLAVDRVEEADDVCARGLALDADNKPLRAVAEDIVKRATQLDAKRKKEEERVARNKRREMLIQAALKARGIPVRRSQKPPDTEDAKIALDPDPDDPRSALTFPTLLLYPLQAETDFIKAFAETQSLEDHLSYVLPPPWDEQGVYGTADGVECYVETKDGGVLRVGKRVALLKVLGTGRVEIVDQVLRIFVLPKGKKAEEWVVKFKAEKAERKGNGG